MKYRASSLCIIRRGDKILLEQSPEERGIITFRPVGGTIEYGEDSKSAVVREVKEEINEDIIEPNLIGVVENIYQYEGEIGHEYDFIYEAKLAQADAYKKDVVRGNDDGKDYLAVWKSLDDIRNNPRFKLVPDGLYEMLRPESNGECVSAIKHVNTKDILNF